MCRRDNIKVFIVSIHNSNYLTESLISRCQYWLQRTRAILLANRALYIVVDVVVAVINYHY